MDGQPVVVTLVFRADEADVPRLSVLGAPADVETIMAAVRALTRLVGRADLPPLPEDAPAGGLVTDWRPAGSGGRPEGGMGDGS
jgi:hypothetical protein